MKTTIKQKIAGVAAFMLVFFISASKIHAQAVNAYKVNNNLACSIDVSWIFYNGGSCDSGTITIPAFQTATILSNALCPTNLTDVDITVTDVAGTPIVPSTVNFFTQSATGTGAGSCTAFTMQWFGGKTTIY